MICLGCLQDPCTCGHKLPDSRSRSRREQVRTPFGYMDRVFCANCGANGGLVTPDTPIHYQCQPCADKYGKLDLPEVTPISQEL